MFSANTGAKASFPWGMKQPAKAAGLTFGGGVLGGAPKQAMGGVSTFKVTPSHTASLLGAGAIKPKQPWQQSLGAPKPNVIGTPAPTKVEVVDLDGTDDQPTTNTPIVNKPPVSVPVSVPAATAVPSVPAAATATQAPKSNVPTMPSIPSALKADVKSTTPANVTKPASQPSAPAVKLPSAPPTASKPLASTIDKQIKSEAPIKTETTAPVLPVNNADGDAAPKKKGRPKKATTHYVVGDVPNAELKVETTSVKPEVVVEAKPVVAAAEEDMPKANKKKRSIDEVLGLIGGEATPATKKKAAEPVEMETLDEPIHTHQVVDDTEKPANAAATISTKKLLPKKSGKRAMPLHLDEETGVAEQVVETLEETTPTPVAATAKVRKPRAPKLDEAGNPIPAKRKKTTPAATTIPTESVTDDKPAEDVPAVNNGEVAEEPTAPSKPRARKPKEPQFDAEGNLIEPKKRATKPKEPQFDAEGNPIEPKKRAIKPKEPQFDADGNPIEPKKRASKPKEPEALDADGNPIPKKRGRKPKDADAATSINEENKMDVTLPPTKMEVDVVEPVHIAPVENTTSKPKAKKTVASSSADESTVVAAPKAPRKRAPAKPKPNAINSENITYGEDGRPRVRIPLNETEEENDDISDDEFDISRRLDESFGESDIDEEDEEDDEIDEESDDDSDIEVSEEDDLVIVNEDEYGNAVEEEIVIDDGDDGAGEADEDDEDRNFVTKKVEKVSKPVPIRRTKIGENIYKDSLFKGAGDLDVTNIISGKRQRYRPYNDYLNVDTVLKKILPESVIAEDDSKPIDLKAEDEILEFDDLTPAQKRRVNQLTGKKSEARPKKPAAAPAVIVDPIEVDDAEAAVNEVADGVSSNDE